MDNFRSTIHGAKRILESLENDEAFYQMSRRSQLNKLKVIDEALNMALKYELQQEYFRGTIKTMIAKQEEVKELCGYEPYPDDPYGDDDR